LAAPEEPDEDWKTTVNLLAVIVTLLVLGAGIWLIFELDKARKAQSCLSSGMAACRRIQTN
jgi:heme/copper-type cytochrome/quinol oxidase subunit 4